jgi:trans-aconitate 2-methyltransferase
MAWSPQQYLKFEDERTRPARDLLQAAGSVKVARAADLGCGPGTSTELIAARFPDAEVTGVDSSEDMIEAARERLPGLRFTLASIEDWNEAGPWDLLYANAALQWVKDHESLLPRLAGKLSQGGCLAIQMPDNLNEPSHAAMRTVAQRAPFAAKLAEASKLRDSLASAGWYYSLLKPYSSRVDIWKTTYFHPLAGLDAIVEWVKGSGLRPFLDPLAKSEREIFLAAYKEEIGKSYKPFADGTVILPFPRLFIVAVR